MINKKKSVLVLTTSFPIFKGIAVGIHVLEKCKHLVKNGWNVKVIAPSHFKSKKKEEIDGIKVIRFSYFFPEKLQKLTYGNGIPTNLKQSYLAKIQLPLFMLFFFFNVLIRSKNVDIIHCHWSLAGLIGVMVGKVTHKKVVFMMHGAEVFVLGDHPLLKFILKNCDYLICNSTFSMEKTLSVYPVKRHKVISPGVDINRFYPQQKITLLKQKLNIPKDGIFILTIGKFIKRKGIKYLIQAMHLLINQEGHKNIYLRIGGRGPLKSEYKKLINKYNLCQHISFLDYIKDDDIPSYYTEADIFVLPSIIDDNGDTEGLGVVFLEANACETAIIGSKVGGIIDVIKEGKNGYFIKQKDPEDIAEKLKLLINNKDQRQEMGQNGRKHVAEFFNWNKIAKKIISVYQTILAE